MEEAYYSSAISKTECFPQLPWPLLCYHYGSSDEVQTPESLRTAFPQCSACRHKKVRPKESGKSVQNEKAARIVAAKKQKQDAAQAEEWAASKQPVPPRVKEWNFSRVVGRSKRYGYKIHWETEDGTETERDQCTWQPLGSVPGDKSVVKPATATMLGSDVTLEFGGKAYIGVISDQHQPDGSKYFIVYKKKSGARGRVKASAWLDMELPTSSKCSWWRLDGYETYNEDNDKSDSTDTAEDMELDDGKNGTERFYRF